MPCIDDGSTRACISDAYTTSLVLVYFARLCVFFGFAADKEGIRESRTGGFFPPPAEKAEISWDAYLGFQVATRALCVSMSQAVDTWIAG